MKTFQPIEQLMQKRMSRRDFLKHLGAIVVAMVGIRGVVEILANPAKKIDGISGKHTERVIETKTVEKVVQGYGNTPYGI